MIAKEGLKYLIGSLLLSIVACALGFCAIGLLLFLFSAYTAFFFRNPKRAPILNPNSVLSPADGKVIYIGEEVETEFLNVPCRKISVFMSLWDVHINRAPIEGVIRGIRYFKGEFKAAYADGVSNHNERNLVLFENSLMKVLVTQVAGLIARRIVCDVKVGDSVTQGNRYGLIQFGSRCDVFVPLQADLKVKLGDKVKAGISVLATV